MRLRIPHYDVHVQSWRADNARKWPDSVTSKMLITKLVLRLILYRIKALGSYIRNSGQLRSERGSNIRSNGEREAYLAMA